MEIFRALQENVMWVAICLGAVVFLVLLFRGKLFGGDK